MYRDKEYFLDGKSESNFAKIRREFKCSFCAKSEQLLRFIREKFCWSKEEITEIKEEILHTEINAKKFEKVEEHVKNFFMLHKNYKQK